LKHKVARLQSKDRAFRVRNRQSPKRSQSDTASQQNGHGKGNSEGNPNTNDLCRSSGCNGRESISTHQCKQNGNSKHHHYINGFHRPSDSNGREIESCLEKRRNFMHHAHSVPKVDKDCDCSVHAQCEYVTSSKRQCNVGVKASNSLPNSPVVKNILNNSDFSINRRSQSVSATDNIHELRHATPIIAKESEDTEMRLLEKLIQLDSQYMSDESGHSSNSSADENSDLDLNDIEMDI